jgi:hypothetical protein
MLGKVLPQHFLEGHAFARVAGTAAPEAHQPPFAPAHPGQGQISSRACQAASIKPSSSPTLLWSGLFQRRKTRLDILQLDPSNRPVKHALGRSEPNGWRRTRVDHQLEHNRGGGPAPLLHPGQRLRDRKKRRRSRSEYSSPDRLEVWL